MQYSVCDTRLPNTSAQLSCVITCHSTSTCGGRPGGIAPAVLSSTVRFAVPMILSSLSTSATLLLPGGVFGSTVTVVMTQHVSALVIAEADNPPPVIRTLSSLESGVFVALSQFASAIARLTVAGNLPLTG